MRKQKMNRNQTSFSAAQQGIVLLEALIAILIFSMGILAIAGLQAAMVKNTSDAKYRSDAAFIAQQRLGMMWSDPEHPADFVETDTPILLPNGKRTVTLQAVTVNPVTAEVQVVVTWQLPGQELHNYTTDARIAGGG